jgi:DNA-binding transcriptional LysR family regulator
VGLDQCHCTRNVRPAPPTPSHAKLLDDYPQVDIRLLLLDRVVSLVDEGLDLGVRIGRLPDSTLRAVRVGQVRRIVCATPQYIARRGVPATPHDLRSHSVVACTTVTPVPDRWSFHHPSGVTSVTVTPRLVVNTTAAAVDAALEDWGLPASCRIRRPPMRRPADSKPSSSNTSRRPYPFTSFIRKAGTSRPRSVYFWTMLPKDSAANSALIGEVGGFASIRRASWRSKTAHSREN